MLLLLLDSLARAVPLDLSGDSRVLLSARAALAGVAAFVLVVTFGRAAIAWLQAHAREQVRSASAALDERHAGKNDTPTMGGLPLVAGIVAVTLLTADPASPFVWGAIVTLTGLSGLGAFDDWRKSRTGTGITPRQKLAGQTVVAFLAAWLLDLGFAGAPTGDWIVWPFGQSGLFIGPLFPMWAALVMVGSSNGVNLTDGLDGLATGCLVVVSTALAGLAYLGGHRILAGYLSIPYLDGVGELTVVLVAVSGAALGFLWFNCHPAQVFMGDSGSLPLGGILGYVALATRQEALLLLIGGVFVVETLSVIAQIGCFRLTGRRLIRCSPLHNHFVLAGESEHRIVVRFWIGSALLAVVAFASLKID